MRDNGSMTVQETWEAIQREATKAHAELTGAGVFARHRGELERVRSFFGSRRAMEFAWSELEIPSLAFLVEFGELENGEAFGLYAL
jgi:hypothetical protein